MALVFAGMHIYTYFFNCVCPFRFCCCCFLSILLKNTGLINRRNGPRYQRVQALCAFFFFFNRGDTARTNSSKILCLLFIMYVLFYVNLCRD